MRVLKLMGVMLVLGLLVQGSALGFEDDEQPGMGGETPPRLSFADGQVSFWRPGSPDWIEAQVNMPLATGDQLYVGESGNLEVQTDGGSFVRAGRNSQIGLGNLDQNYTQFRVTAGAVSLDIRSLDSGKTVEVDAPNAAFIIDRVGYYRLDVNGERTSFTVHRSGHATVAPADGETFGIGSGERIVLDGTTDPQVGSYRESDLDRWDQWCLSRTDDLLDSQSGRYVSRGVYGLNDLDRAGVWQDTTAYGAVWMPTDVPEGWAPYSNGSWIMDPVYGWTWVDAAPWGWAPYHYGRWISLDGRWFWAPGPPLPRPLYAPALVAFFGNQGGGSGAVIGWVPLGWGEPLVPWWGPERFRRPWWGGWGGPRGREVESGRYQNLAVGNGMMVVSEKRFGRGHLELMRSDGRGGDLRPIQADRLAPGVVGRGLPVGNRGIRPSDALMQRPVVESRPVRLNGTGNTGREQAPGIRGHVPVTYSVPPAPRQLKTDTDRNYQPVPQGGSPVLRSEEMRRPQNQERAVAPGPVPQGGNPVLRSEEMRRPQNQERAVA
ncbi:MAG: hypothetical protein P4L42_05175, partial [Desulfocapsaceae bacterium]|nr:hypothetical protein [Desulfocapsaceae bacterium]